MQAIGPAAARKPRCHIGDIVKMKIVQHDELAIPSRDDILLEIVCALPVREDFGFARMLGQIAARAAMRDDCCRLPRRCWYARSVVAYVHDV